MLKKFCVKNDVPAGDHITDERDNTDKLMIKDRKSLISLCAGKYI